MQKSDPHPGILLDLLIVAIALGLLVAISKLGFETGRPVTKGAGSVVFGIYIVYLGVLFLLSYFFPRRSYILRFLDYLCRERSYPAGRWMAWFYFALSVFLGTSLLLIGLGVF